MYLIFSAQSWPVVKNQNKYTKFCGISPATPLPKLRLAPEKVGGRPPCRLAPRQKCPPDIFLTCLTRLSPSIVRQAVGPPAGWLLPTDAHWVSALRSAPLQAGSSLRMPTGYPLYGRPPCKLAPPYGYPQGIRITVGPPAFGSFLFSGMRF